MELKPKKGNHMTRVNYANYLRSKLPAEVIITPLEEPLKLDEVDAHRYYICQYYDQCIVIASYLAWVSFSCSRCPIWEKQNG